MRSENSQAAIILHTPVRLGALELRNRIVMAPLTRQRVNAELVPDDVMVEYYLQRATAGLIISESIAVAPYGAGWGFIPGLYTPAQRAAWRKIVQAVHDQGGLVVAQLFHAGRARREKEAAGRVGPWAVTDPTLPHELTDAELRGMLEGFKAGAQAAKEVGFDAVEVHSGTGLMIDRFLRPGMNQRQDRYGGTAAKRIRMHLDALEAVSGVYPAERIGIKLAPSLLVNGAPDPHREETFALLLEKLGALNIAYAEFTRVTPEESAAGYGPGVSLEWLRAHYSGNLLAVNGFSRDEGAAAIEAGLADAIVFGRAFISNPDLPRRFALNAAIAQANEATFYTPGPAGLIDYPALPA